MAFSVSKTSTAGTLAVSTISEPAGSKIYYTAGLQGEDTDWVEGPTVTGDATYEIED